ncbi:AGC family protein kinase [Tritrichomonas foetus]|uniref:non-specific serine/threonine protein kinase n=1 Tax=Tritrichomonas foetus TaxID=1144522 RepID=A0A1J4KIL7_9EUKA|nr:AGC family protein kinase [Tritrichomonas foetus]|eukprot:OHT11067.1 AGC family protein kinase [Tritrichomonas foetus]
MADSSPAPLAFSGWLKKKGSHQGLWHRRFVVLSGSTLTFSKDAEGKVIDQVVNLPANPKVSMLEGSTQPRFTIEIPGGEPLILNAEKQVDANRWIAAIRSSSGPLPSLSMDQFKIVSVLGRGYYGKVMLVQKKDTGEIFAIKSIQKSRLVESGKSETVIAERNIMMKAHHPFIVSLCFAFQTPSKFYLGLEYAPGGELFYHMDKLGVIQIDDARLYTAEIGLALSYLHSIGIVYRDLKPENILLDANGHIKLTDFGLSKDILATDTGTATTFCGTSEYLAPEVVMQMPYSYPIDMWALGVLVYEMILGTTPFYDENKAKMFTNIVGSEPFFPPQLDRRISDFIGKLLDKDPNNRPRFEEIKSHPFFEGFNWDKVYNREYRPNFIPPTKDPLNPTNFDPEFTNEAAADSYVPPAVGDVGNVPGFSYIDSNINDV